MDEIEIRKRIRAAVVEQACGEWDDTTIEADTDHLMVTIKEILADYAPARRVQDLLEANNRYLDRARTAEAILSKDVSAFVNEYEFRDVAGDYTPTSVEKMLIEDALTAFVSQEEVQKGKGLDFSEALHALKAGQAVSRAGWNGKGMFLYMVPAATYKAQTLVAKALFGEDVPYGAYTAMKTADGNVVPWLCSQSDQYATDWEVVVPS